jgi:environmental stress-induced protein Ves
MKLLRAADRSAIPWKNGGGVTRDVIVSPAGATMDDFDWRISIADIVSNGPFSRFPGIDRKLAVLKGKVALTVEGVTTVTLDPHTAALDFHGEAAVQADLVGGPSRDLNVMTRRGRFVSRIIQRSAGTLTLSSGATVMVALGRLTAAGHDMEPLDALLVDDAEQSTLTIGPADFCLIEISPWP